MNNDYLFKVHTSGDIIDLEGRVIGHLNLEDIKSYAMGYQDGLEDGLDGIRPKGEWIMQRHDLDGCFYTCSNCGRMIRVSLFIDDPEDNETLADYPFCHCGADMRGSK